MLGLRQCFLGISVCSLLVLTLSDTPAHAGLVSTEQATGATQAASAREHIKVLAQRPELAKELQARGVPIDEVQARVDAMTDAEVIAIADKVDSLPAGGALSNNELILVLVVIIVLLIAH